MQAFTHTIGKTKEYLYKEPLSLRAALFIFLNFRMNIHYLLLLGLDSLPQAIWLDDARQVANCLFPFLHMSLL